MATLKLHFKNPLGMYSWSWRLNDVTATPIILQSDANASTQLYVSKSSIKGGTGLPNQLVSGWRRIFFQPGNQNVFVMSYNWKIIH